RLVWVLLSGTEPPPFLYLAALSGAGPAPLACHCPPGPGPRFPGTAPRSRDPLAPFPSPPPGTGAARYPTAAPPVPAAPPPPGRAAGTEPQFLPLPTSPPFAAAPGTGTHSWRCPRYRAARSRPGPCRAAPAGCPPPAPARLRHWAAPPGPSGPASEPGPRERRQRRPHPPGPPPPGLRCPGRPLRAPGVPPPPGTPGSRPWPPPQEHPKPRQGGTQGCQGARVRAGGSGRLGGGAGARLPAPPQPPCQPRVTGRGAGRREIAGTDGLISFYINPVSCASCSALVRGGVEGGGKGPPYARGGGGQPGAAPARAGWVGGLFLGSFREPPSLSHGGVRVPPDP
ncbi:uncharacterized protein, partial [Anas platyrhynchos]|uniref:uncharacterized protein n=1 Tax=Anas platyrhynchos TaxID=8839 RepID=UPI003AF1EA38